MIVPERIASDTGSVINIIRQGVVISSNEKGIIWLIGNQTKVVELWKLLHISI